MGKTEELETLITALEKEHKKLREMQSATDINVGTTDTISREPLELARAIDGLTEWQKHVQTDSNINRDITIAIEALKAQLGTNLAEVGTDCISRLSAISALDDEITITGKTNAVVVKNYVQRVKRRLEQLPPAQPEIIRCKDCIHNKEPDFGFCEWANHHVSANSCCADVFHAERRTDG